MSCLYPTTREMNNGNLHLSGEAALTKVRVLLKRFRSAMMITSGGDTIHSRPMALHCDPNKFDGVLWFFTDRYSRTAHEVNANSAVSLLFQNDGDSTYMHLYGHALIWNDQPKMRELFTPVLRPWFPDGVDDPRMTLIRFEAANGSFWDCPSGLLRVFAAFTKSLVSGAAIGSEKGEVEL